MTLAEVERRLAEIEDEADDNESAHADEDMLYRDLLAAIAEGRCENPAECARAALTTKQMKFSRWYA